MIIKIKDKMFYNDEFIEECDRIPFYVTDKKIQTIEKYCGFNRGKKMRVAKSLQFAIKSLHINVIDNKKKELISLYNDFCKNQQYIIDNDVLSDEICSLFDMSVPYYMYIINQTHKTLHYNLLLYYYKEVIF